MAPIATDPSAEAGPSSLRPPKGPSPAALAQEAQPIPSLDSFPPTGKPDHDKLSGYDLYRALGSPRRIVAPMVDQSELAWRVLSRRHGADLVYTPMIHSAVWCFNKQATKPKHSERKKKVLDSFFDLPAGEEGADELRLRTGGGAETDTDRPLVVQFCANDPDVLLEAARDIEDRCDAVDLNLGCPQGIAKRGRYGAFLMEDWPLIFRLVNTLHLHLRVPVTAKMRVYATVERTVAYARMLERAGAQIITVHGRTRDMKGALSGMADWEKIRAVKESVSVPVFANGNVLHPFDWQEALRFTGADGVMSAEGNLYLPTVFQESPPTEPSKLYPDAPRFRYPSTVALADEYLDIVASLKTLTSISAIRGHLFKMARRALAVHPELRSILGPARPQEEDAVGEARVAPFRAFVRELERKLEEDRKDPKFQEMADAAAAATSAGGASVGIVAPFPLPGQETYDANDSCRPLYIPHWLTQPYVRPPPPPDMGVSKKRLAAAQQEQERQAEEHADETTPRSTLPPNTPSSRDRDGSAPSAKDVVVEGEADVDLDALANMPAERQAKRLRAMLEDASQLKARANESFVAGRIEEAVVRYQDALAALPPRGYEVRRPTRDDDADADDEDGEDESPPRSARGGEGDVDIGAGQGGAKDRVADPTARIVEVEDEEGAELLAARDEVRRLRSVVFTNLAACHLKNKSAFLDHFNLQEDWKATVTACNEALQDDPDGIKALYRRAQANERIGGWSALSSALEDYRKLSSLPATPSTLHATLRAALARLPPRVDEAARREKDEMLAKLKHVGDRFLGVFGLSTDNFKLKSQQGGGYGVEFVR